MSENDRKGDKDSHKGESQETKPPGTNSGQDAAEHKKPQQHKQQRGNEVSKLGENAWHTFRRNANSILVIITAALVVVTTISNWMLIHDQRAADIADLRPYIIYDGHQINITGDKVTVYLRFHNAGKTPAVNVDSTFEISTFAWSDPSTLDQKITHTLNAMSGLSTIGSQVVREWAIGPGVSRRPAIPMTFLPTEIENMKSPNGWVLAGEIHYTDSFRRNYLSEYCVYGKGGNPENSQQCPRHNDLR